MAARKCPICNEPIGKNEETIDYKQRKAHIKCFNIHMKAVSDQKQEKLEEAVREKKRVKQPKAKLKDGLSEEEFLEKKKFFAYVKGLMLEEEIPVSVYAMVDRQVSKYGFSYKGMRDTLVYLSDIKEMQLKDNIVGIIPTYYSEAQRFYDEVDLVEKNNTGINIGEMYKEKVIIVKSKKRKIKQLSF